MTQYFNIHHETPQKRLLDQTAEMLRDGAVVALPTDSCYSLACHLDDAAALDKIRKIRGIGDHHLMTLMCRDLSDIGQYARVDNSQYRLLKLATPGAYTFVLEGTKELPRRILHPKRKTLGLRIPDNRIMQGVLEALGEPLLTTTLVLSGDEDPLSDGWSIKEHLESKLDLVVEGGWCGTEPTTVIDLCEMPPTVLCVGHGPLAPLGLE
ncbi:MAG: YciO protein, TsaC/YrdC-like protein [Fluviibacter phosphoraccumulans EoVTN8]